MKRLFAMFMALALTALGTPCLPSIPAVTTSTERNCPFCGLFPFVCMLLSIAIGPLAVPHFWHHHFGKVASSGASAFLVPCA